MSKTYRPLSPAYLLTFIAYCVLFCSVLTCLRQESANERYGNTAKDLLFLPNTVSQKNEKPHTARLDDTAIPHVIACERAHVEARARG